MSPLQLVLPSSFCHNPDCADYGKVEQGNVRKARLYAQRDSTRFNVKPAAPHLPSLTVRCYTVVTIP